MAFPPRFQRTRQPVEGSPAEEALESAAFEAKEDRKPKAPKKKGSAMANAMRRRMAAMPKDEV